MIQGGLWAGLELVVLVLTYYAFVFSTVVTFIRFKFLDPCHTFHLSGVGTEYVNHRLLPQATAQYRAGECGPGQLPRDIF